MRAKWIALGVGAFLLLRARLVFAAKPGTVLSTRPEMNYARGIVSQVWRAAGYTLTVTSGYDGTHGAQSKHGEGLAEDYRTRDVAPATLGTMVEQVRARLGSDYDVVLESDHLHVEFDPT
jgi:hypothetical protein